MGYKMFGVILWSDPDVRKAVIWCEDHGDLAYYEGSELVANCDTSFFDAGDYVEFDVTDDQDLRRASNAQTVLAASYPMVANALDTIAPDAVTAPRSGPSIAQARVIQLSDHRRAHSAAQSGISRRG